MAPFMCWSFNSSMFRYRFVDHAVPAACRSLAAARSRADWPSGNAPTTPVRRLIGHVPNRGTRAAPIRPMSRGALRPKKSRQTRQINPDALHDDELHTDAADRTEKCGLAQHIGKMPRDMHDCMLDRRLEKHYNNTIHAMSTCAGAHVTSGTRC
jgi:hypothetical protein